LQHIEGAELNPFVVPAGMQRVEIGVSVNAQDDCLAVDHEMAGSIAQIPRSAGNACSNRIRRE